MGKISTVLVTFFIVFATMIIFSAYRFRDNKLKIVNPFFTTSHEDTSNSPGTHAEMLQRIQKSVSEIIAILTNKLNKTCKDVKIDIMKNTDHIDKLLKVLKFLPENLSIEMANIAQGVNLLDMEELQDENDNEDTAENNEQHAYVLKNYSIPTNIDNSSIVAAESSFFKFLTKLDANCPKTRRMGTIQPGGWDICVSLPFVPKKECLVYSFGINYDFSFDADMVDSYQCTVRSYDPSMDGYLYGLLKQGQSVQVSHNLVFYKAGIGKENGMKDHVGHDRSITKWLLKTFGTYLKDNNEEEDIIDVLKIDVEYAEWESLEAILKEGSLKNVKQFVIEVHTPESFKELYPVPNIEKYDEMFNILSQVEKLGFRKYFVHHNHFCKGVSRATGKTIESCYEVSYFNINFIRSEDKENKHI